MRFLSLLLLAALGACVEPLDGPEKLAKDVEQMKTDIAVLRDEIKDLRTELARKPATAIPMTVEKELPTEPRAPAAQPVVQAPARPASKVFTITEMTAREVRRNSSYVYFGWRLRIRNDSDRTIQVDAEIQFLDAGGFEIEDHNAYDIVIGPGEEALRTDSYPLDISAAGRVSNVQALVEVD